MSWVCAHCHSPMMDVKHKCTVCGTLREVFLGIKPTGVVVDDPDIHGPTEHDAVPIDQYETCAVLANAAMGIDVQSVVTLFMATGSSMAIMKAMCERYGMDLVVDEEIQFRLKLVEAGGDVFYLERAWRDASNQVWRERRPVEHWPEWLKRDPACGSIPKDKQS